MKKKTKKTKIKKSEGNRSPDKLEVSSDGAQLEKEDYLEYLRLNMISDERCTKYILLEPRLLNKPSWP